MIFEKGMDMFFEVKGSEAMCFEATIFEVMGKRILEAMGKMIFEVMCLEFVDIEVTNLEAKSKMIFEGNKVISEQGMDMHFELKGSEAMCFEVTIIKVLGKRFIEVKGKMILEVIHFEATNFKTKIHDMKGIEVVIVKVMDKARTLEESSFEGKGEYSIVEEMGMIIEAKGSENTIVEEMGLMRIIVTKGLELISEALGKEMSNAVKGQDEFWRCWGRPLKSSVCC